MDKWEGAKLNEAKEILAYELTKMVHSEEEAEKAKEASREIFSKGNSANMPTVNLLDTDFVDDKISILDILVKAGLVQSKSEARRNIEQGGVTVEGEKITDTGKTYTKTEIATGLVVARGKKNFKKVIL